MEKDLRNFALGVYSDCIILRLEETINYLPYHMDKPSGTELQHTILSHQEQLQSLESKIARLELVRDTMLKRLDALELQFYDCVNVLNDVIRQFKEKSGMRDA